MSSHVVPLRVYLIVFGLLLLLTALTIGMAYQDLGALNTPLALGIAVTKAALVVLFFMHVRYTRGLTWVFVAAGFLWLAILLVFTLTDIYTRDWLPFYGPSFDVEIEPGSAHQRETQR